MRAWLSPLLEMLSRGEAAMLVHIVELKGSGPRETGAQMLVGEHDLYGTIGGGELERTAMLTARELLQSGRAGLATLALGPELNQCCGGSVVLAFEPFASADRAWVKKLFSAADEPVAVLRTIRIDANGNLRREWSAGGDFGDYSVDLDAGSALEDRPLARSAAIAAVVIRERVNTPSPSLWLFGAGHVGQALASALRPLGFAITWIDGRAGVLPQTPPAGMTCLALAMPELAVEEAPPGTSFLVMTHSHPLDEAICEAVLRRGDFAYLGLIGSATKRARFVKRLGAAGIPPARLERLVCPIGLPGIASKEPASIAASVAADLLLRRERIALRARDAAVDGR